MAKPSDEKTAEIQRLSDLSGPVENAGNAEEEFYAIANSGELRGGMGSGGNVVDKDALVGVPMIIKTVTYHDGRGEFAPDVRKDMVSIEAIIAPQAVMDQMNIDGAKFASKEPRKIVRPGMVVIFNDSGTGIYRRVTAELHKEHRIEVDPVKGELSLRGKANTSAFDEPRSEWLNGEEDATTGIAVKWLWEKGLSKSKEYDTPNGPAVSYYVG